MADMTPSKFQPLYLEEGYPNPDPALTKIMGADKEANWKAGPEAPCTEGPAKKMRADSKSHREE